MTPTSTPTTTGAPQLAGDELVEKRRRSLERANDIRTRRARLREDLRFRRIYPQEIVVDPPEWMETATVEWVLLASPRIGPARASRILKHVGISPTRELGRLSPPERRELAITIVQRRGKAAA